MGEGRRSINVGWGVAGCAVLFAGLALAGVHGMAVVDHLWFVDDAVSLDEPGRYRVQAARSSTWTLLVETPASAAPPPISVRVRAADGEREVPVTASAASYEYSRAGKTGSSVYDFQVPTAGEYDVQLSFPAGATLRLVDDVPGRLQDARRAMIRAGSLAGGALALSLALFTIAYLMPRRRRTRVVAPAAGVAVVPRRPATAATAVTAAAAATATPSRNLRVLPALPTSVALQRYGLAPPKGARARVRPDTSRVPSVA